MKKIVTLFVASIMPILFIACSSNLSLSSSKNSSSSESVSSEAPVSSSVQSNAESSESGTETGSSQIAEDKEFDLTQDKFIGIMDEYLKSKKLTLLSNIKPTVKLEDSPGAGLANCYDYALGANANLLLYVDRDNNNIVNIGYTYINKTKSTNLKNANPEYYYCIIKTIAYMASDEALSVGDKLKIDNISQNDVETATTQYCDFSHVVDGVNSFLTILPNS